MIGDHLVNNIMMDLDEFLIPELKQIYKDMGFISHSYIWKDDLDRGWKHIAFRHPGSTRGHIEVDENLIIKDIVFYEDTCEGKCGVYCGDYEKTIKEKYIGTKLNIEPVIEEDFEEIYSKD